MISASSNFNSSQNNSGIALIYYAVGDIHGRLDLLNALLEKIFEDAQGKDWRLVFLGDYVDRGPHSKGVIQRLIDLKKEYGEKVICLRGNHELIFLSALRSNEFLTDVERYMNYGLDNTIRSYGVTVDVSNYDLSDILKNFRQAVPDKHLKFLYSLKSHLETEHAFFSHAGIDPDKPLNNQDEYTLLWGSKSMLSHSGKFDKLIVHGHYAVRGFEIHNQRICIDTGAVWNNILTCCIVEPNGSYRFLNTAPAPAPKLSVKSLAP